MNNLYVVQSPLQALCAVEISLSKINENHFIIVKLGDKSCKYANEQILRIIRLQEWQRTIIWEPLQIDNKLLKQFIRLKWYSRIKKEFKSSTDSLYIGDFRYSFTNMIRSIVDAPNVYLMDDGSATVVIIKDYIMKGKYSPDIELFYPKNLIKKIIIKGLYGRFLNKNVLNKKLKVITLFGKEDIPNGIYKLQLANIKALKNNKNHMNNKMAYYYGSCYSEAGIISLEYELDFLYKVKKYYNNKGFNIVYCPHRRDSETKLSLLTNKLNFIVKRNTDIAELDLLNSEVLPQEVSGAYTSTLNNIKHLFPEINVTSFKLNPDKINPIHRKAISDIYTYYAGIGINIKEFNS